MHNSVTSFPAQVYLLRNYWRKRHWNWYTGVLKHIKGHLFHSQLTVPTFTASQGYSTEYSQFVLQQSFLPRGLARRGYCYFIYSWEGERWEGEGDTIPREYFICVCMSVQISVISTKELSLVPFGEKCKLQIEWMNEWISLNFHFSPGSNLHQAEEVKGRKRENPDV